MIDEFSDDESGWARFSDDKKFRYRLARTLHEEDRLVVKDDTVWLNGRVGVKQVRCTFVMLNPSTADAFKLDPTVTKCRKYAALWGAQLLEVVNLYALRSPDPKELDKYAAGHRGDDIANDEQIYAAVKNADIVIAAWGANAWRGARGVIVRTKLNSWGVRLQHLGTTQDGWPLHPLARGKSFIPMTRTPVEWL